MIMDQYIDGVVPQPITDAERGFLRGLLIENLLRIHAAFDDEGNDLSALPKKAADRIEKLQKQRETLLECMYRIEEDLIVGKSDDLTLAEYVSDAIKSVKEGS